MRSLMKIGAMSFSSLKTSEVLVVKAAEAWAPGMVATDVGGINENRSYLAFLGQRYERMGGGEKTAICFSLYKISIIYLAFDYHKLLFSYD